MNTTTHRQSKPTNQSYVMKLNQDLSKLHASNVKMMEQCKVIEGAARQLKDIVARLNQDVISRDAFHKIKA